MQEIRDLGKLPKEVRGDSAEQVKERNLSKRLRLRYASRRSALTAEQEAELTGLREREVGPLAEVSAPPDPLNPSADESDNRLEQDLLMLESGMRSCPLLRRLQH